VLLGLGSGFGDDFERDNFDFVQAAVAATPAPAIVRAPPSWLATPFSAAVVPAPPPPAPWVTLKSVAAAVGAAVAPVFTPPPPPPPPPAPPSVFSPPAPPVAQRIPSGTAIVPSVPAGPPLLAAAAPSAISSVSWTTLAIAGAAGVGLILLLRR
jgi:hypothetical protein